MKKTILVVEDEAPIAQGYKILFKEHDVIIVNDGELALQAAKDHKPHLILLDLMLPNRNGYDICFHLRQEPDLKNTKIVMVTAMNQELDKKKGNFVGADVYMTKPFEPAALKKTVMELLHV